MLIEMDCIVVALFCWLLRGVTTTKIWDNRPVNGPLPLPAGWLLPSTRWLEYCPALHCTNLQSGIASLHRQDISGQPRHTPGPLNLTETVRRSLTAAEIVFYVKFKNQNKP